MIQDDDIVLVTGATGNVGGPLVRELARLGRRVRVFALADDPKIAALPDGVEVVTGDLGRPETFADAIAGVRSVMLMWPFFTLSVDTAPAIIAQIEEQAERVVFVSSIGVEIGLEPPDNNCHAYVEELIEKTSLDWTFLRITGLATNTRMSWGAQIRRDGTVRSPYGRAARASLHEGDLAEVAARALVEDGHAGYRHVVTGPESITQIEHLVRIGTLLDRDLAWEEVPADAAVTAMVAAGWPPSYAEGALDYFRALVDEPEMVTDTVERLLGRPARRFEQWAAENAESFR